MERKHHAFAASNKVVDSPKKNHLIQMGYLDQAVQ
jgi:hypothetical protein